MSNGMDPITCMGDPQRLVSITPAETLTDWPEKERDWLKSKKGVSVRFPKCYRQEKG